MFEYVVNYRCSFSGPCPICKEKEMQDRMTLQCGHSFCCECISRWLGECDNRCPQCRAPAVHMTGSDGFAVPTPNPPPPNSTATRLYIFSMRSCALGPNLTLLCSEIVSLCVRILVHTLSQSINYIFSVYTCALLCVHSVSIFKLFFLHIRARLSSLFPNILILSLCVRILVFTQSRSGI